ncbi:hypothetical protein LXL04_016624 [Taraxacum kok-saghyz]
MFLVANLRISFFSRNPRTAIFALHTVPSPSSTKIVAEYAKSGKSACKKCSEKIDSKSLRLGLKSWDPRGYDSTKWHHFDCFFSMDSIPASSAETIEGFSELTGSDQDKLKEMVSEEDRLSTKREGDVDAESDKRDLKKLKTDEDEIEKEKRNERLGKIHAEYAKSGRSLCKRCTKKIEFKSLRLGLSIWDTRGFENTKWFHSECCFELHGNFLTVESIEGFSELKRSRKIDEWDQSFNKSKEDDEANFNKFINKIINVLQRQDQKSGKTSDLNNEGIGSEIEFADSDVKDNYKGATLQPKWKVFQTLIYLEREDGLKDSSKIAAFDFDGCLAKTSVQRVGANAWSLMYASIPNKLQSLYNDGFKLVIFTNEANIERWKNKRQVAVDSKIGRLNSFIKLANVPIQVFIACGVSKGQERDPFRKPKTGMWRIMEQHFNSGIPIDMDKSFYVGDAAGRKDDHSDADKKFAEAIGLKFYVPEEYFDQ